MNGVVAEFLNVPLGSHDALLSDPVIHVPAQNIVFYDFIVFILIVRSVNIAEWDDLGNAESVWVGERRLNRSR
jgi:hypothetical protein